MDNNSTTPTSTSTSTSSNSLHDLILELAIAGLGKIEHSHLLPGTVDAVKPYLGKVVKELIPEKLIPHELHILGRLGVALAQRVMIDRVISQQQQQQVESKSSSTNQPRVQMSDLGRK